MFRLAVIVPYPYKVKAEPKYRSGPQYLAGYTYLKPKIAMQTHDQKHDAPEESGQSPAGESSLENFNKEDLLDLAKGAAVMDTLDIAREKIGGRTIGGAGGGAGTGETGGDFDRPGTEGSPAINDYVDPKEMAEPRSDEPSDGGLATTGATEIDRDELTGRLTSGEEASGYPGGGAVRTAEDRLPAGETDENTGFSPESPLNK